jgi:hypothetical protein
MSFDQTDAKAVREIKQDRRKPAWQLVEPLEQAQNLTWRDVERVGEGAASSSWTSVWP